MSNQPDKTFNEELHVFQGIGGVVELGYVVNDQRRRMNRYIVAIAVLLILSVCWNVAQFNYEPAPRLLGETNDGRIRPIPRLSDAIYNDKEILAWAERCVKQVYGLNYITWREKLQNEVTCLSDESRKNFVQSLRSVGVIDALTPAQRGVITASPQGAVLRQTSTAPSGVHEWIVEVPFRLSISAQRGGSADLVMQMRLRRVSFMWREDGIWVEAYVVKPKSQMGK